LQYYYKPEFLAASYGNGWCKYIGASPLFGHTEVVSGGLKAYRPAATAVSGHVFPEGTDSVSDAWRLVSSLPFATLRANFVRTVTQRQHPARRTLSFGKKVKGEGTMAKTIGACLHGNLFHCWHVLKESPKFILYEC